MKKQMRTIGLMSSALLIAGGAGVAQAAWDTSGATIVEEELALVDAIDDLAVSSDDPVLTTALNTLTTTAQVQLAIETLSPGSVVSGISGGIQASGGAASGSTMGRMASLRSETIYAKLGQAPVGPGGTTTKGNALGSPGVWGRALAASGDQDEIDDIDGYDYDSMGLMFGYDMKFGDRFLLGVNAGYVNTDVDAGVNTEQDVDTLVVGVYGTWVFSDLYTKASSDGYVDFGFSYNASDIDYDRDVIIGASTFAVKGDTDSDTYIIYSNVGYNFFVGDTWIVTPEAGILYSYSDIDGYTETGTGALDVDDDTVNLFSTNVAVKSEFLVTDAFHLKLKAAWNHEYRDDNQSSSRTRFVAAGSAATYFKTEGIEIDDDKFALGLGGKFNISDNLYLDVEYTYEFADEYDAHIGDVSMKYSF